MSRLLQLHDSIGQMASNTPEVLEFPQVARSLEQQLLFIVVRCLTESVASQIPRSASRHEAIVARLEAYLEAHPDRPLYLVEICAALGTAERTLRAACENYLGMGPIRYLSLRRMHLVRRALLRADRLSTTVTRIAFDHGFCELGRFAVAYRELFGEKPSATLRRSADERLVSQNRPSSLSNLGFA